MNKTEEKKLFEIAKLAEEKGFKTKTVTTCFTNDYLLGVKNVMITEMCIYLWLCELQKWLREVHKIDLYIEPVWKDFDKGITQYCPWVMFPKEMFGLDDEDSEYFDSYEKALENALLDALTLIK